MTGEQRKWLKQMEGIREMLLEEIVCSAAALPLTAMRQGIIDGVSSYSAEPLQDDVSRVLVEVR